MPYDLGGYETAAHNSEGNPIKTIENRFYGVSNENKERAELSVPKREQATIFSEDHEVGIPSQG